MAIVLLQPPHIAEVTQEYPAGKVPEKLLKGFRLVLEGDSWTVYQGEDLFHKRAWSVDPSKSPKRLDVHFQRDGKKVTAKGIYKLEGDTLTIVQPVGNAIDAMERPTEFKASGTANKSYIVEVWKRQKK
jgi:uncharacterized protein (TIGR03067 family)